MNESICTNLQIGMKAPDFIAETTFGTMKMSDYKGNWVIFFSHPGDFTPVCTTEFIAFSKCYPCFECRNTKLLGLSVDSNPSHLEWVQNITRNTGVEVPFPIIADPTLEIARLYGMVAPNVSETKTIRDVFVIDDKQIIRTILIYPLTIGRNIPEILRIVDALQTSDKEKVVIPANWMPGQPVIVPPPNTYDKKIEREQNPEGLDCIAWYLCYKNLNK